MNREQYNNLKEEYQKFFDYVFVGEKHGQDGTPYTYSYNSSHPDLKPTSSVRVDGNRCPYCGEIQYPIQANIREFDDYNTTGYVCFCEKAQIELEYKKTLEDAEDEHNKLIYNIKSKYSELLKFDREKLLKIKYERELDSARSGFGENNGVWNSDINL